MPRYVIFFGPPAACVISTAITRVDEYHSHRIWTRQITYPKPCHTVVLFRRTWMYIFAFLNTNVVVDIPTTTSTTTTTTTTNHTWTSMTHLYFYRPALQCLLRPWLTWYWHSVRNINSFSAKKVYITEGDIIWRLYVFRHALKYIMCICTCICIYIYITYKYVYTFPYI